VPRKSPCAALIGMVSVLLSYDYRTIMSTGESAPPTAHLGALLRTVWQGFRDEMIMTITRAGFDDIGAPHMQVFSHPGPEGLRPSEIAERLGVSKQTVNDLIGHLESCGYVHRVHDPVDGRARIVRPTNKGKRLEAAVRDAARIAEANIAAELGNESFQAFRSMAQSLASKRMSEDQARRPLGT